MTPLTRLVLAEGAFIVLLAMAALARRVDDRRIRARNDLRRALHGLLLEYAERLRIPVSVVDEIEPAFGHRLKPSRYVAGAYVASIRGLGIELDRRHTEDAFVLAHELGHHIAIRFQGDHSEEGADREAGRIIRQVLAAEDLDVALDVEEWKPLLKARS